MTELYNKYKVKYAVGLLVALLVLPVFTLTASAAAKAELPVILEKTAGYCDKLEKEVIHFFCYERVVEKVQKSLKYPEKKRGLKEFLEGINRARNLEENSRYSRVRDQARERRRRTYDSQTKEVINIFINGYQIIKGRDRVKEERKLIKYNGKPVAGDNPEARTKTVLYAYKNAIAPLGLFARENQDKYAYKVLKKEKVLGRKAYAVAINEAGDRDEKNRLAVAWVDAADFSVLKIQVFPAAFAGYEYLVRDAAEKKNIEITDVHYFGKERNGARFPSKTEISLSYTEEPKKMLQKQIWNKDHGAEVVTKLSALYEYKGYRFFSVSVGEPQFKDLKLKR